VSLSESARLVVEYDTDAECPRGNWSLLTGFHNLPAYGDRMRSEVPAVFDFPGEIESATERLMTIAGRPQRAGNYSRALAGTRLDGTGMPWNWRTIPTGMYWELDHELMARWARVFYGLVLEFDSRHGGYWFVSLDEFAENWPELEIGTPEHFAKQSEVIASEIATYEAWADGEVYGVTLERAITRHISTVHHDDTVTRDTEEGWEPLESLWGNYCDAGESVEDMARRIAREYFTLTIEEIGVPA
jgi:hypothetical protein